MRYTAPVLLRSLHSSRFRSLRDAEIGLGPLTVLIGANASGKSNVLDALRLLAEAVREKDFAEPVRARGGMMSLAWKGQPATSIDLRTTFDHDGCSWTWTVTLKGGPIDVRVVERLEQRRGKQPASILLESDGLGEIWWWSPQAKSEDGRVRMVRDAASCALAEASGDPEFPGRPIGELVARWGFFDPSPAMLRQPSAESDADALDRFGRNLAARLYTMFQKSPQAFKRIVDATRAILGLPDDLEPKLSEEGRVFFTQREPGLLYSVHQLSASSGTLRMLAFMAALFGDQASGLVGIEEPENHVHPSALKAFAEHLREAAKQVQVIVTTHSPLLLDCLPTPSEIRIVKRTSEGTQVAEEPNPEAVEEALDKSGFGLGEFYETSGFGGE